MSGLFAIISLLVLCANLALASWGSPGSGQYHIQTDEGPERFFRYQTDNGQYRKEKRLQDGTVIGTDAWIDAAGYLRQNDYIADQKGYRILKARTVFVGHDKSIEDAMKSAKKTTPQSGTTVPHRNSIYKYNHNANVNNGLNKIIPNTRKPILHTKTTTAISPSTTPNIDPFLPPLSPIVVTPSPYLGFDHYPQTPIVDLHHNSQPIDDNHLPENIIVSTTTEQELSAPTPSPPSQLFLPPFHDFKRIIRPIAVINTTPSPIVVGPQYNIPPTSITTSYSYATPAPFSLPTSTPSLISTTELNGLYNTPPSTTQRPFFETTTRQPIDPLDGNDIVDVKPIHNRRPARPYNYRPPPLVYGNKLGSGYEPQQFAEYNGVSVTRDGFGYYLPRQYHEEENIDNRRKAGSFGYIDPFGIRRVIYYNASPENGFVHRKNNKFVGFNAPPYDPRPHPEKQQV